MTTFNLVKMVQK